jgi:hypothetical protein
MPDPADQAVEAAIERGDASARLLIAHRNALMHHLGEILPIAGAEGVRACAAGAAEAVIAEHEGRRWGGRE